MVDAWFSVFGGYRFCCVFVSALRAPLQSYFFAKPARRDDMQRRFAEAASFA